MKREGILALFDSLQSGHIINDNFLATGKWQGSIKIVEGDTKLYLAGSCYSMDPGIMLLNTKLTTAEQARLAGKAK